MFKVSLSVCKFDQKIIDRIEDNGEILSITSQYINRRIEFRCIFIDNLNDLKVVTDKFNHSIRIGSKFDI